MILRRSTTPTVEFTRPTVRRAERKDLADIVTLWRQLMDFHAEVDPRFNITGNYHRELERHFVESMKSQGARILVVEYRGEITGYIHGEMQVRRSFLPAGKYGFICDLCVANDHRRNGYGKQLVDAMMEWFKSQGVTSVELFYHNANPVSSAFWEAQGFDQYLRLVRKDF